jgi:hypothetical protein
MSLPGILQDEPGFTPDFELMTDCLLLLHPVHATCRAICVLGVDFMSENVRAILDEAGYTDVQVRKNSVPAVHLHRCRSSCSLTRSTTETLPHTQRDRNMHLVCSICWHGAPWHATKGPVS